MALLLEASGAICEILRAPFGAITPRRSIKKCTVTVESADFEQSSEFRLELFWPIWDLADGLGKIS